jgi:hypothetical protein
MIRWLVNNELFVCLFLWASALQPTVLLYRPLWTFQLWPPDAPAPTDAFRTLAADVGTYGRRITTGKFASVPTSAVHLGLFFMPQICDMGPTALLPLPKEGVLRIFPPLNIRRLRPGLNPQTWVPEASTLIPRPPKPLNNELRGYGMQQSLPNLNYPGTHLRRSKEITEGPDITGFWAETETRDLAHRTQGRCPLDFVFQYATCYTF